MTDQGERAPNPESAASTAGRTAAIDAAFAAFPDFGEDGPVSADPVASPAGTPVGDDQQDSASTTPAPKAGDTTVNESARPVEGQNGSPASKDALEAPKHWPKDRRELFQTLPDDAKRVILERNKEANVAVTKAQQEAAQFRHTHEALTSVFTDDHRQQMRSAGMNEIGAIQYLVAQHDALNRDPVSFLKAVIAQTGVKAEQLFGASAPGQQQQGSQPETSSEWRDPDVIALEKQLAELRDWKVSNEKQAEASRRQAQEAKRNDDIRFRTWLSQHCDAFETAIDDEGNPKYPHLPAVMQDMVRLVQSDPAVAEALRSKPQEALEQVYNQALYLHPEIRDTLIQQRIDAETARRMAEVETANSVKKAQAAATRKGSPGANGQAQTRTKMSREDAINKAMNDLGIQ